ncbi:collagen-binding domain-containing protein [Poseidonocella sedimentorum]|uniref:VPLPA-CTERM protein sorting domain-containing protein n=1 Tax=Poseidonocella sedimentorum TaxID=871652 RepID=A0A1I6EPT0_9RHOB|nr:collagen-binding domain-containing protein [Poseidonocella sedimentorum]SFR19518.1 VPLPA-CTERM protein sorting domain-containing protein [Poseidonocella sedimentorum]
MKSLFFAAALAVSGAAAQAATLSASETLEQFVLVTEGDLTGNSVHVHGRSLIGGDLSTDNWSDFFNVNADEWPKIGASVFAELIVAGNATSSFNVNQGGDLAVAGAISGTFNLNDGGSQVAFDAPENYWIQMEAMSADLSAAAASASAITLVKNAENKLAINAGGVYTISATELAGVGGISYGFAPDETVIINVTGDAAVLSANMEGTDKGLAQNVIWNFESTNTVTLNASIFGTVVATDAKVTFHSDIEGSLIASLVDANAQIHVQTFLGELPEIGQVPLPAALPLLLAGLGVFGAVARRKS